MSERLFEAFREEAVSIVDRPDFDQLARRGRQRRLRRRAGAGGAMLAVAAVVGGFVVLDRDPPRSIPPADDDSVTVITEVVGWIPPGRAELPPVSAMSPASVVVTVTVPESRDWQLNSTESGMYAQLGSSRRFLHLASYVVDGVATRPCAPRFRALTRTTPEGVANAIAAMGRAEVVTPPRRVSKWGTTAVLVTLRVPSSGCPNGNLFYSIDTDRGSEIVGNLGAEIDFWVVEVDDQVVVVEAEYALTATPGQRAELDEVVDSIWVTPR